MYQTPLTTFVPGRSFSPGHPSLEISMEQFEKESVGREFVVYYPKEWQDGFADRIMSHNTIVAGLPAVYHMKRPGSDIYQFAYLKVPYSDTMSGYNTRTAFDQDAKAFYPIVVGSTYAMLIFGTIFLIIGILVLLSAFVLLCEEYDFDPFNYISKRFSR